MKKQTLLILLFGFACALAPLFAQMPPAPQATNPAFDHMKSLMGNWEGTTPMGKVNLSFKMISNGTALMENMDMGPENMVTTYYPDGDHVMMTHYCGANNQPRMKAEKWEGNTMTFSFVDATNLSSPDSGHMHKLAMTMTDQDHLTETWTWVEKGQERSDSFQLERKK